MLCYAMLCQAIPSAIAAQNGMPVVQANAALLPQNVGTMGGSHGQSHITDDVGHVLARGPLFGEALLVETVELAHAAAVAMRRLWRWRAHGHGGGHDDGRCLLHRRVHGLNELERDSDDFVVTP